MDLSDYEIEHHSFDVNGETFKYDTHGPEGFADSVAKNLGQIAATEAGAEMLQSMAGGDGNLLIAYGRANGEGIAPGYTSAIQFNHTLPPMLQTNIGYISDVSTHFALAHELHHSWGPVTNKGFWSLRGGNDRIDLGPKVRGSHDYEIYATRYTNMIRQQSGSGYIRTHYDGHKVY